MSKDLIPFILNENIGNLRELNAILLEFASTLWDRPGIFEGSFETGGKYKLTEAERHSYKRVTLAELEEIAHELGKHYQHDSELAKQHSI
jgi:hypothetical protein